jgi:predicted nucleic acid-binding protein
MSFVLDASITLAWCFGDETSLASTQLLEKLDEEAAYVPELWGLEVGNILVAAERRKRITHAGIAEFLSLLSELNIQVDKDTSERAFHEIISLAYSENLTTYDAAYLELAMRLGLPLASKDAQLQQAAKKLGVKIIGI